MCRRVGIPQPPHGTATSVFEAEEVVDRIGLPALVRPSYVLGGRAMRIIYTVDELTRYLHELYGAVPGGEVDLSDAPLLIDRFLEGAVEVDIDAVYDGSELYVGAVMEHVEEAGVHSGDSACVVPPPTLSKAIVDEIIDYTTRLASALEVRGLINIQFAVRGEEVFVLEANPRASRTVPFISKATDVPLAKVATRVMMGETLAELRAAGLIPGRRLAPDYVAVKEAVLPWSRFPGEDTRARPRDASDRRGDGHRCGRRHCLRQGLAGCRPRGPRRRDVVSLPVGSRQEGGSGSGPHLQLDRVPDPGHARYGRPPGSQRDQRNPRRQGGRGTVRPGSADSKTARSTSWSTPRGVGAPAATAV